MTHRHDHRSRAELQAYVDGQAVGDAVRRHLATCERCRGLVEDLRQIDLAMRSLPLERVEASFAERIMAQVGVPTASAGIFRFIVYLPSALGLALVLGIMAAAYVLAGGAGGGEAVGLEQVGQTAVETLDSGLETAVRWLASLGSSTAMGIVAFALGLLAVVALGELVPGGALRRSRERLRDSGSA